MDSGTQRSGTERGSYFIGLLLGLWTFGAAPLCAGAPPPSAVQQELIQHRSTASSLLAQRRQLDQLLWAPELLAQSYESRFVELWDALLANEDKFAVLAHFPFRSLILGKHEQSRALELQIAQYRFGPGGQVLTPNGWQAFIADAVADGYRLEQSEWHHSRFQPPEGDRPAESELTMKLHVARDDPAHRIIIRGILDVVWQKSLDAAGVPVPDTIAVRSLEILGREQPPAFREVFSISGGEKAPLIN